MDEKVSTFLLEDGEGYVDEGFDAPVKPVKDADTEEEPEEQPEDLEPEVQPEADIEPEPEPEETKPDPTEDLRRTIALQQQQMAAINQRLQQMQNQTAQQQVKPEEQEPPLPTEDDWAEDPTRATQMVSAREQFGFENKLRQREQERTQQQAVNERTNQSWNAAVQMNPALGQDGSEDRHLFQQIYHNPDNKLVGNPVGPLLAAGMVRMIQQAKSAPEQTQQATQAGIQQERSRQARVKGAVMHGSGKGGGQTKVTGLSPEAAQAARDLGLSPESYMESMKELGGI